MSNINELTNFSIEHDEEGNAIATVELNGNDVQKYTMSVEAMEQFKKQLDKLNLK